MADQPEAQALQTWLERLCSEPKQYAYAQSALWYLHRATDRLHPAARKWLDELAAGNGFHAENARRLVRHFEERPVARG